MASVLLLGPAPDAESGIATHVRNLLSSKLAHKYDLALFQCATVRHNESLLSRLRRLVKEPWQFIGVLWRSRPQLVHVNSSMYPKAYLRDLVFIVLSRVAGTVTVVQFHGGDLETLGRLWRAWLKMTLRCQSALVVITQEDARYYASLLAKPPVIVINNGVPVEADVPEKPERRPAGVFRLVYVGRLIESKGLLDVIAAMSVLSAQGGSQRYKLSIAGTGPISERAVAEVEKNGLGSDVVFLGTVLRHELKDLLRMTDLMVIPTYHKERMPYAVLEGMAEGVPAVTCRSGALEEVVRDGIDGIFVPPNDPVSIASVIAELAGNPELLLRMSRACRNRVVESFSVDRMAERFDGLYADLLVRGDD